jgi:hypothetical protein
MEANRRLVGVRVKCSVSYKIIYYILMKLRYLKVSEFGIRQPRLLAQELTPNQNFLILSLDVQLYRKLTGDIKKVGSENTKHSWKPIFRHLVQLFVQKLFAKIFF